jgi:hypothetical protein
MHKPVAIQFDLATQLRNEKSQFFQSEAKPLRKRTCSKVTFMQPYGVLELRYYLGA